MTQISLAAASIIDNNGNTVEAKAAVSARDNSITYRVGGAPTTRSDVKVLARMSPGKYRVEFDDGSWWTITRSGGCGCGGR